MGILDYYQLLRVAPNASRKEIDEAYHRLLKESRYDTSIDRLQIENAYRILSDLTAKTRYDARNELKAQRIVRANKKRRAAEALGSLGPIAWLKRRTLPQLLVALGILLTITIIFYSIRFGYLLRSFEAGDVLYDSLTDQKFGKILRVEPNHPFGEKTKDAYQVELAPSVKRADTTLHIIWLPQDTVKMRCYKKD